MGKKYFASLCLTGLLAVSACSFNPSVPEGEFQIQGKLMNIPDSTVIELRILDGHLLKLVANDTLIGGEFSFRDTITSSVRELYLMASGKGFPGAWVSAWVAPGQLTKVNGTDKLIKTWTIESDVPEQAIENQFLKAAFPEQLEVLMYKVQEADLFQEMFVEHPDDEAFGKVAWSKVDSLRKLQNPLERIIQKKELDCLKETPVSIVWLTKYLSQASRLQWDNDNPYAQETRDLYELMSEADRQTELGKAISEFMKLEPQVNVGDEMADSDLYDLDGNLRHISEFKGKYILLDFWSLGCGPCVQSIPEMEEIAGLYKDKLAVVSINGDSKEDWKSFVAEKKMTGNQWNELRKGRTGLAARYQTVGIPHYVLISPEGKIQEMWTGYGPGSLKEKLDKLVK